MHFPSIFWCYHHTDAPVDARNFNCQEDTDVVLGRWLQISVCWNVAMTLGLWPWILWRWETEVLHYVLVVVLFMMDGRPPLLIEQENLQNKQKTHVPTNRYAKMAKYLKEKLNSMV